MSARFTLPSGRTAELAVLALVPDHDVTFDAPYVPDHDGPWWVVTDPGGYLDGYVDALDPAALAGFFAAAERAALSWHIANYRPHRAGEERETVR